MKSKIIIFFIISTFIISSCKKEVEKTEKVTIEPIEAPKAIKAGSKGDNQLNKAILLLQSRKYQELIEFIGNLPIEKRNYKMLVLMGEAHIGLKKYDEALNYFKESVDIIENLNNVPEFDKIKVYNNLALAYQKLKKFEKTLETHQKIAEILPDNSLCWSNIGYAYYNLSDFKESEKAYEKALSLDSNAKPALKGLSKLYIKSKQYEKAIEPLKKIIDLEPRDKKAYFFLAQAYQMLGKTSLAYENRAKGYFLSNRYKETLSSIEKYSNFRNDKALLKLYIAALMGEKNFIEAAKESKLASEKFTSDDDFVFNLAQIEFLKKDYKKAVEIALEGIKTFPESHVLHVVIANSYNELKNNEEALRYYKKVIKIKEDDVNAHERLANFYRQKGDNNLEYYHQGIVYFYTGDYTQAENVFSWIKGEVEDSSRLNYYTGMVFWAKGKKDESIEKFNKSIELNQSLHLPYLALSRAYKELDKKSECKNILNEFIKKNPDSKEVEIIKEELKKSK